MGSLSTQVLLQQTWHTLLEVISQLINKSPSLEFYLQYIVLHCRLLCIYHVTVKHSHNLTQLPGITSSLGDVFNLCCGYNLFCFVLFFCCFFFPQYPPPHTERKGDVLPWLHTSGCLVRARQSSSTDWM